MDFAVGDALLAAQQLRELAVDVVLISENALLDLHDLVPAVAKLHLDVAAQLDRLLPGLDRRLAPSRLRVATRFVEKKVALAARGLEPRSRKKPQQGERAGHSGCDCDHDCHDVEHAGSYGLIARTTLVRRPAFPGARRACAVSSQVRVCV